MKKQFLEIELEIYEVEVAMTIFDSSQKGVTDDYTKNEWELLG